MAQRRVEVDGAGEGLVGVDGAALGHGGQVADGGERLESSNISSLSVAKTTTSASIRSTFSPEISAWRPCRARTPPARGDREPELGEEVGAETVGVDVELAVVGAALGERRGQVAPLGVLPRRPSAYRSMTPSTSAWPSASRPSARAIWRVWSDQEEK